MTRRGSQQRAASERRRSAKAAEREGRAAVEVRHVQRGHPTEQVQGGPAGIRRRDAAVQRGGLTRFPEITRGHPRFSDAAVQRGGLPQPRPLAEGAVLAGARERPRAASSGERRIAAAAKRRGEAAGAGGGGRNATAAGGEGGGEGGREGGGEGGDEARDAGVGGVKVVPRRRASARGPLRDRGEAAARGEAAPEPRAARPLAPLLQGARRRRRRRSRGGHSLRAIAVGGRLGLRLVGGGHRASQRPSPATGTARSRPDAALRPGLRADPLGPLLFTDAAVKGRSS